MTTNCTITPAYAPITFEEIVIVMITRLFIRQSWGHDFSTQSFLKRFIYNQYINDHVIHPSRAQVKQTRLYNVDVVEWSPLQELRARNYSMNESLFTSSN